jgi:hypothetical protein
LRKIGGHEQIQVIKQVYKEMSWWNSLYSYIKQTNMPFFKNEAQESKTVLSGGW